VWGRCPPEGTMKSSEMLRKVNLCLAKAKCAYVVSAMIVNINKVESKSSVVKTVRVL
jgi:hypothetical protein